MELSMLILLIWLRTGPRELTSGNLVDGWQHGEEKLAYQLLTAEFGDFVEIERHEIWRANRLEQCL